MAFATASLTMSQQRGRSATNVPFTPDDLFAPTDGMFHVTNMPFHDYVRFAYNRNGLPTGLPDWDGTDRFDIDATAQGNPTKDQYRLMLQSLLAQSFKLVVHHETRELPIYRLEQVNTGILGPQLKPDNAPCSPTPADVAAFMAEQNLAFLLKPGNTPPQIPCGTLMLIPASVPGRVRAVGIKVPNELLTQFLPNPASGLDRPLVDGTGLSGKFDMTVEFTPVPAEGPPGRFTPDATGPKFAVAIERQLGLKLEPETGPVDVLVIDHVEHPAEN
jgi:uncharacterized protein (TIGR03435 family)